MLDTAAFTTPAIRSTYDPSESNCTFLLSWKNHRLTFSSLRRQIIHARYECNGAGARMRYTVLSGYVRQCQRHLHTNGRGQVRHLRWDVHLYWQHCAHLLVVIVLNKQLGQHTTVHLLTYTVLAFIYNTLVHLINWTVLFLRSNYTFFCF